MAHAPFLSTRRALASRAVLAATAVALTAATPAFARDGDGPPGGASAASSAAPSGRGASGTAPPAATNSGIPSLSGLAADLKLVRSAEANGDAVALRKILPTLKRVAPGKVLHVAFTRAEKGFRYTFTMLTAAGHYVDVSIDAKTSELIGMQRR